MFFSWIFADERKGPDLAETGKPCSLGLVLPDFLLSNGFKGRHRWESHSQPVKSLTCSDCKTEVQRFTISSLLMLAFGVMFSECIGVYILWSFFAKRWDGF